MDDLCQLPAHELVRLMTTGSVSCSEVARAHLARIEAVNPMLNALVEAADPVRYLQLADHADSVAAQGDSLGTSADGLPIGVQVVARPWQDATALAVAGHLEKVFGGWQPPPVWC